LLLLVAFLRLVEGDEALAAVCLVVPLGLLVRLARDLVFVIMLSCSDGIIAATTATPRRP
jgi:hypothetical protein